MVSCSIAVIYGQNPLESIMWLPRDQLYVLVYLVTVSHSMMAGYMDKAQKYTEKALAQIEKLKSPSESQPILSVFQIILLEHIVMCRLVMGNTSLAVKEIAYAKEICCQAGNEELLRRHGPQLHCVVGLYAMTISYFDQAEKQFLSCIQEASTAELKLFANLNLAIIYLRTKRERELKTILERLEQAGLVFGE